MPARARNWPFRCGSLVIRALSPTLFLPKPSRPP